MNEVRYPFDPLIRAVLPRLGETVRGGEPFHPGLKGVALLLGVHHRQMYRWKTYGLTRMQADDLAGKAGFHPADIWPEIVDDDIADASRPCAECGESFVPTNERHRFCVAKCRNRHFQRLYQREKYTNDPEFRRRKIAASARYYEEAGEYVRTRQRRLRAERKAA